MVARNLEKSLNFAFKIKSIIVVVNTIGGSFCNLNKIPFESHQVVTTHEVRCFLDHGGSRVGYVMC